MPMSADLLLDVTGMSHSMPSTKRVEYFGDQQHIIISRVAMYDELDMIDILRVTLSLSK